MYPHQPGGQGQHPSQNQWPPQQPPQQPQLESSHPHQQPPYPAAHPGANGAYHPAPSYQPPTTLPPLTDHRPDMATLQQQHPQFRLPAPHTMYQMAGPPHDPYRQQAHMPYASHQPAPRQRTAIACRYCRRRKIRCSGFESSEDGRCTNCARFSQECVFTPVSAQTQAFVPAHTVYRGGAQPPPQLYGAYGQPLPNPQSVPPQQSGPDPYAHARAPQYPLTSPTHYAPGHPYPPAPAYEERNGNRETTGRKRPANEPHTPTLPPPNPATSAQLSRNQASEYEYKYPDPTALTPSAVSPASSSASYHSGQQQPAQQPGQPYYATQGGARRPSPTASSYSYEHSRASSSPRTHGAPGTPNTVTYPPYPGGETLRPPKNLPYRNEGRTPPPPTSISTSQPASTSAPTSTSGTRSSKSVEATTGGGARPGMTISSIMTGDGQSPGARSAADNDMLKRFK